MNGFHVIIRAIPKEQGGGYEAEILELPGVFVFGTTLDEVKENVRRRINSWMGLMRRLGWVVNIDFSVREQGHVSYYSESLA